MLTITTTNGTQAIQCDDYCVRELSSGYDEVIFQISIYDPLYPLIQEEASIVEKSSLTTQNSYLVKAIDAGRKTATIKAQIDLDEWKATLTVNYSSQSSSVAGILNAVKPSGWAVIDRSGITYSRTIHLDSATPLDVLEKCRSTFSGVTFRFNNTLRTVTIVNMNTETSIGAFASKDLNLKENNYMGKSTGFVTRLYAYGKDGLSFADINNGKPYVECHEYSNRVICGYWKDERYTIAANLLADAQERVNSLGVPKRSYDCKVVDLAAVDPTRYGYLDFTLFTTITLLDDTRASTGVKHQIIERWIYPNLPHNNKVVLSTTAPKIQNQVTQIIDSLSNPNSDFAEQQESAVEAAAQRATAQITGADGGYIRNIYDANGKWIEQVIMNTEDILTATKVWRWNMGGLGYSSTGYNGTYGTAITQNGEIVANYITTGTLDASLVTVSNLNASNINTGTLSADRIGANTITVGKLTGSITGGLSNSWEIDLTNGTLTIGNISASNITTGTLDASNITVTNLNAQSITAGYISAARIEDRSLTGTKIELGGITGGVSNGQPLGELGLATISGGNIGSNTITGGSLGNLSLSTITTSNTVQGIVDSLGYADLFNAATQSNTSTYPTEFTARRINAIAAFYSGSFKVQEQGSVVYDLTAHYHSFTEQNGKIYMSSPTGDSTHANFNIADTQAYRDGVAAVTVASRAVLYCNASNYSSFDTGFDCDMTGSSYYYAVNGVQYGRIDIRNSSGTTLKTIRVKLPAGSSAAIASITAEPMTDTSADIVINGGNIYLKEKLKAYSSSSSTTPIYTENDALCDVGIVVQVAQNAFATSYASVLTTDSTNYTSYDTGYSWGTKLYNPNLSSSGSSVYGRIGLYSASNSLLKTYRFALSMSVQSASTSSDYSDYYTSGGEWYLKVHVKNSSTEIYQSGINVQRAVDWGQGGYVEVTSTSGNSAFIKLYDRNRQPIKIGSSTVGKWITAGTSETFGETIS